MSTQKEMMEAHRRALQILAAASPVGFEDEVIGEGVVFPRNVGAGGEGETLPLPPSEFDELTEATQSSDPVMARIARRQLDQMAEAEAAVEKDAYAEPPELPPLESLGMADRLALATNIAHNPGKVGQEIQRLGGTTLAQDFFQ